MKLGFVFSPPTAANDISWHAALPRPMRKALRHVRASTLPKPQTHVGVDTYLQVEYRTDTYHVQNLEFLDRGYDFDEFGDIDNELDGLTITDTMSEVELFEFCTGYNII
jgi:hypothetical protein